jgi:hypothetical protein
MAYSVEEDPAVREYLHHFGGLSREARIRLFTLYNRGLRDYGDVYRGQPHRRLRPGSRFFQVAFVIQDEDDQRQAKTYRFRFVVDDSGAQYGVLRVVFVDHTELAPGPS